MHAPRLQSKLPIMHAPRMAQRMPLALFAASAVLSHFLVPPQRRSNMAPQAQGCGRGTIHQEACELQEGAPAKYGMPNSGQC